MFVGISTCLNITLHWTKTNNNFNPFSMIWFSTVTTAIEQEKWDRFVIKYVWLIVDTRMQMKILYCTNMILPNCYNQDSDCLFPHWKGCEDQMAVDLLLLPDSKNPKSWSKLYPGFRSCWYCYFRSIWELHARDEVWDYSTFRISTF